MADLWEDGYHQEHDSEDEILRHTFISSLLEKDQTDAGQGHGDSEAVQDRDTLFEEQGTGSYWEDRYWGDDHRADGRRAGLFYAVGLAEEVDKWLKESEQQKFPDIFAGYQAEVLCEDVEEKKYDSGDKNP